MAAQRKRFPKPLVPFPDKWDKKTADLIYEQFQALAGAMEAVQGTPSGDPVEIGANNVPDTGVSGNFASSGHVHGVETAAPTVNVQLGGTSDEGSGNALMRADARLVLDSTGASPGDVLEWDGSAWVPTSGGGGGSTWTRTVH